ncbi:putative oxygen-independent coproporphyrinogen III oxidase [Rhizophagus irregularis]|nr:putative oxygen-independent coproporphyrinogen III oxidase [Rhizophagus irregularis]
MDYIPYLLKIYKLAIDHKSYLLKQPLMIYIHWPFCKSKCTYCNFNKYINPKPDHERMKNSLISEIKDYVQKHDMKGRIIHSIYFGGGTPSLALPSTFEAILNTIANEFILPSNTEITMEGNPTSTETGKLQNFHSIGINRLSLGLQSLNDMELKRLGRDHTSKEAISAIKESIKIFRENVTFDLMFGREGQTVDDWKVELKNALEIASDHISLYELTIKKGTPLYKDFIKGKFKKPSFDNLADLYNITLDITKSYGFQQYEVSNFQRNEKYSKHNYGYWSGLDYLGIGPGAHGRLTDPKNKMRYRTIRRLYPENWMKQCEETGEGIAKYEQMNLEDIKNELILFGLRTRIGIPRIRFKKYSQGQELEEYLNMDQVNRFIKDGFLIWENNNIEHNKGWILNDFDEEIQNGGLRPTKKGLAVIDEIVPRIIY